MNVNMTARKKVSCGVTLCSVPDISSDLELISHAGYEFIVAPIIHPRNRRELVNGTCKERVLPLTRPDLCLSGQDWSTLVVGKLSPYLNVDSPILDVRHNAELALEQELMYASHLGLPAIMIKLSHGNNVNFARIINSKLTITNYQVWVHVPMVAYSELSSQYFTSHEGKGDECEINDSGITWEWWQQFHNVCNVEKKVSLALEISANLPSEEVINRWLGEPIRCVILPTHIFLTNKKSYPVLSQSHQRLLASLFQLDVQFVIQGSSRHGNLKYYLHYLEHLWQMRPQDDPLSSFAQGYEDLLQCPLQPLADNLETRTYEIFEIDPVKYREYQRAMQEAYTDMVPEEEKESRQLVVMVVGAGRGPLVRAALSAADNANRSIKVYAVEKNPNAIVTLLTLKEELWGDSVTVVSCDMREFCPPEKADILVSELLGSFGDNELSPECLDGAQKFLKEGGISIPASYTSYLSPIQSPKLFAEARSIREIDKNPQACFETPYVVHLQNKNEIDKPQPLFTFSHPNQDKVKDNNRYKCLSFEVSQDCAMHGLAGYFETVLYKDVTLSIVPDTRSLKLFSWFPILFPIKEPLPLKQGDTVDVHFWRLNNQKSVWYEWCITSPAYVPVHNPNGRSYSMSL